MSSEPTSGFSPLALRDRAYAFLASHELATEDALLAHVYGGIPPAALRARFAAPLLGDPRLERRTDGQWAAISRLPAAADDGLREVAFTALALVATGPSPGRGRVVQISALHLHGGRVVERFSSIVNPGKRVPAYVAERIGLAPEVLEDLPPFASTLDDLMRFLDTRPVVAQDARLAWAFVEAEARRVGQALADRVLIDANELATHLLDLPGKPTLALVAAQLGIGTNQLRRPDEEARVLGLVATRLLSIAAKQGLVGVELGLEARSSSGRAALRSGETVRALADVPGIYVMRDLDLTPLYVGKARRLRSRVAAYVNRPLGATRRLEGLVGAVERVDSTECATDLEALILEDQEIRRLQPRFNTVRRQRPPRLWIRLPPTPAPGPRRRPPAPVRLELSLGPATLEVAGAADGEFVGPSASDVARAAHGEFVGPFRNETLAARAQLLARRVFALDTLRRREPEAYVTQLQLAWDFLHGEIDPAVECARRGPAPLLRMVLDFDLQAMLLPADPRLARYAVLRPTPTGIEAFLIDRGMLRCWVPPRLDDEPAELAAELLADAVPRTTPDDTDVVLRWFGAQRPPACLVHLPDDPLAAAAVIADAVSGLRDGL